MGRGLLGEFSKTVSQNINASDVSVIVSITFRYRYMVKLNSKVNYCLLTVIEMCGRHNLKKKSLMEYGQIREQPIPGKSSRQYKVYANRSDTSYGTYNTGQPHIRSNKFFKTIVALLDDSNKVHVKKT